MLDEDGMFIHSKSSTTTIFFSEAVKNIFIGGQGNRLYINISVNEAFSETVVRPPLLIE